MTQLDLPSILSLASTCNTFHAFAAHILSFLPNFHLPDIAPSMELLRPLLRPDSPYLRSLKVDCTRLHDCCLDLLLRPSLQELCLRNCADFSGKLMSQLGRVCTYLWFLYLSSVDVLHLEEMLNGCSHLEKNSCDASFVSIIEGKLHYCSFDKNSLEEFAAWMDPSKGVINGYVFKIMRG